MSQDQDRKIEFLKREVNYLSVVIMLFAILILFGWGLYIMGRRGERYDITHNSYPLIDPAREIIPQQYFITNIQPLRDYLEQVGVREGQKISVYYEQLNTGANISVNKDTRFYLASLVKLPTAMIAMRKLESGAWKHDTIFSVDPSLVDAGSGNLHKNTDRTGYTFDELMTPLIVDSDNTAHNVFTKNFTEADFNSLMQDIGLEELFDTDFKGSAKEYSRMLRSLYTSSYLNRSGSEKILELMTESKFDGFLSSGLPEGIKFAHKYGENTEHHIFADAGIVYVPHKPYMLTVIYQGKDGTEATEKVAMELMKEISAKAYEIGK